jgi:hypothetical protein
MAYPEPIPAIKAKDAKKFDERLESFQLTAEQKAFYKKARANFPNKDD